MATQSRTVERILARMAARAEGIVTHRELRAAGVSKSEILHRRRTGLLVQEYRGVYRVGHGAPSVAARYMAAVKACGEGAALSGQAAAWFYGLTRGLAPAPEVTAATDRRVRGVITHRARIPVETTTWRRMPITTVPRTLVDLAAAVDADELARACHEAGVKHNVTPAMVEAVVVRRAKAPGTRKLRRILRGEVRVALSRLEKRFAERLAEAGLPLPQMNRRVDSYRVDCRWPEHRVTVELDSYRYHNSRHSWVQDRKREREARRRGDEFRRYAHEDVFESPAFMLGELRDLLNRRGAPAQ